MTVSKDYHISSEATRPLTVEDDEGTGNAKRQIILKISLCKRNN